MAARTLEQGRFKIDWNWGSLDEEGRHAAITATATLNANRRSVSLDSLERCLLVASERAATSIYAIAETTDLKLMLLTIAEGRAECTVLNHSTSDGEALEITTEAMEETVQISAEAAEAVEEALSFADSDVAEALSVVEKGERQDATRSLRFDDEIRFPCWFESEQLLRRAAEAVAKAMVGDQVVAFSDAAWARYRIVFHNSVARIERLTLRGPASTCEQFARIASTDDDVLLPYALTAQDYVRAGVTRVVRTHYYFEPILHELDRQADRLGSTVSLLLADAWRILLESLATLESTDAEMCLARLSTAEVSLAQLTTDVRPQPLYFTPAMVEELRQQASLRGHSESHLLQLAWQFARGEIMQRVPRRS
jgi:hypothetical protein